MNAIRTYAEADGRAVLRDSMIRIVLLAPLAIAILARFGLPIIERYTLRRYGFDLTAHREALLVFLLIIVVPMLFGMVAGLLLLDDRDDGLVRVLLITPVSLRSYLWWRSGAAGVLSVCFLLVVVPLSGLLAAPYGRIVPAILLTGPVAAVLALVCVALARDRLEGLAVMKALSLIVLAPALLPFVNGPGEALAALPTGPPAALALRASTSENLTLSFLVAVLVVGAWLWCASFVAQRRIHHRGS